MKFLQPYMKGVTALVGTVITILATHYGGDWWFPMVTGAATVLGTYQVPNTTTATVVVNPSQEKQQ